MRHPTLCQAGSLFVALLTACSSPPAPSADPADAEDTADRPDGDGGAVDTLTVGMRLSVPPSTELHRCQYVKLPSATDVDVVGFSHAYSAGSHHFLAFTTDLDDIPIGSEGQYDCVNGDEPIMAHVRGAFYGGQAPTGEVTLPAGVGLHFKAGQVLVLQAHYLNLTHAPIDAQISMSLKTAPAESIKVPAGFLIFYDPFIDLPAQAAATSGIGCTVPDDVTLVTAYTHYHQRGTGMKIWIDPNASTVSEAPFFQTNDWEHPENFAGPLGVARGSRFRVQCDYMNAGTTEVFQGPNAATSEMCVFAAIYYPQRDDGFKDCRDLSVTGHGTEACSTLQSCVAQCPAAEAPRANHGGVQVGPCWERCVAQGCDGAVDALLPLINCSSARCAAECEAGPATCAACATDKCSAPTQRCLLQRCSP